MKMAKKMLVLAIVATGTLMGSVGAVSAVASPGDPLKGVIISLRGETTGTVKSKGTKKTSASRKHRSVRARNAERRRQRQLKLKRERHLDELRVMADVLGHLGDDDQGELLESLITTVEEGEAEVLAIDVIGEPGGDDSDGHHLYLVVIILIDRDGDGEWDLGGVYVIRLG